MALSTNTSDPARTVLRIELGENTHMRTHPKMFTAGLSIRANTREDPKCPSGKWIKNGGSAIAKEYDTVNKRKFGLPMTT